MIIRRDENIQSKITKWIDLKDRIDPEKERIIEIATLVTDSNLNILAEDQTL